MTDYHTKQRKLWIESVSPFNPDESKAVYHLAWLLSLIFGTRMPHERRKLS